MNEWNRTQAKKKLVLYILLLFSLLSIVAISQAVDVGKFSQQGELNLVESLKLPLKELSGIHWRRLENEQVEIVAVGDHKAKVVLWNQSTKLTQAIDFSSPVLSKFSPCAEYKNEICKGIKKSLTSDWEALRTFGKNHVAISQEFSESAFLLNLQTLEIERKINLFFDGKRSDGNSLIEGMILLKNGQILAAKESNPTKLSLFAPQQIHRPELNSELFLAPGETFETAKNQYHEVRTWIFDHKSPCDFSDLEYNNEKLYILSQSCSRILVFNIDYLAESHGYISPTETLFLPSHVNNAEALTILPNGHIVVGLDNRHSSRNVLIFERPEDE